MVHGKIKTHSFLILFNFFFWKKKKGKTPQILHETEDKAMQTEDRKPGQPKELSYMQAQRIMG